RQPAGWCCPHPHSPASVLVGESAARQPHGMSEIEQGGRGMRPNLAARAGRWSAAHWKTATFGWLAPVVVARMVGNAVGTVKLTDTENTSGENARAERMLDDAHIRGNASEHVLISSARVGAASPAFRRAVHDVRTTLAQRPEVAKLQPTVVAAGGHAALV